MNNKNNRIIISKSNTNLDNFHKDKFRINLNRVTFIFIAIFFLFILYSTRVIYLSTKTLQNSKYKTNQINRADIIDRNGDYISKSVFTTNVGVDPTLVKDKKKLLLKLQYTFPNKNFDMIKKKFMEKNFFILKKITPERYHEIKLLGEKSIRLEKKLPEYIQIKTFFHMLLDKLMMKTMVSLVSKNLLTNNLRKVKTI